MLDDCFKDKKVRRDEEEDAISSSMLAKIIEDSLRVFWEFVRADKDEKNVILNSPHQNHINLQHAADLEVLMNTRSDLQKVCLLSFYITNCWDFYFGLYFKMLNLLISCLAEGEKAQGHTEKWKLHSKKVPKTSE